MTPVGLRVRVPLASFRVPHARELLESYWLPPPSTVYGMLLSYVGEPWRQRHAGARIAYAVLQQPECSTVLRTVWRVKKALPPGTGENRRPDFQQLYAPIELAVWVSAGEAQEGTAGLSARRSLAERLAAGVDDPSTIERFGALCLGESTHLVDELRRLRPEEAVSGELVVPDLHGSLTLPIWPDHVGAATHWGRYSLQPFSGKAPAPTAYTPIEPGS